MYLIKRNGIYYIEYFDIDNEQKKRISTKAKSKTEALKFLSDFKRNLSKPRVNNISLQ